MNLVDLVSEFYKIYSGNSPLNIEELKQAGSDRRYFRIYENDGATKVAAYNPVVQENETFIYYSKTLFNLGFNVPKIYDFSKTKTFYIMQDLGDTHLLDLLLKERKSEEHFPEKITDYYKKTISQLASMQVKTHNQIDYNKAYNISNFDSQAIRFDLNYFKYYFLNLNKFSYNEKQLDDDFLKFAEKLDSVKSKFFMFRDFQARNIMINNDALYFIDYQGGRRGAPHYDLASLLYQAKANIPQNIKSELIDDYVYELKNYVNIDKKLFIEEFYEYVFLRILQTLGAYGNRGIIERKQHFLESIPKALLSLKETIAKLDFINEYPELARVCKDIINSKKFESTIDEVFTVRINSFSYKKSIPQDPTPNGGGFVFDCRGINNPGRHKEFANSTGRDKDVIEFFKTNSKIDLFADDAFKIIEYNVNDYLKRGFTSLMINFGCTGGQHRSVYCAEKIAKQLKNKHKNIKIIVNHIEQNIKYEL